MTVKELVVKLGFKADDKALKSFEKSFKSLRKTALWVGAGVAAAVTGLVAITKNVANIGDALAEDSQKLGITVEALQKLRYSAELAGVGQEQLNSAFFKFTRVLSEAKTGSKSARDAFRKLKLDPKKFKTSEEAVLGISDAFNKMPAGIQKTALAQEFFGRSGAQLIPFLNQGSKTIKEMGDEFESFGGVISASSANLGDDFNDNLAKVEKIFGGIKNAIGQAFLPIFNDLVQKFIEYLKVNKELIKAKLDKFIKGLVKAFQALLKFLGKVYNFSEKFIDSVGGIENALKILTYALAGLLALKVGRFIFDLVNLAKSLKFVGMAGGKILLVAAAVTALLATLKGLYSFGKGGPSWVADFLKWLGVSKTRIEDLRKTFEGFTAWVDEVFSNVKFMLRDLFEDPSKFLSEMWGAFKSLAKDAIEWLKNAFVNAFVWVGVKIGELLSASIKGALSSIPKAIPGLGGILEIKDLIKGKDSDVMHGTGRFNEQVQAPVFNNNPISSLIRRPELPAGAAADVKNVTNNNDVQYHPVININVKTDADPKAIGGAVEAATKAQITSMLRNAMRSTAGGLV